MTIQPSVTIWTILCFLALMWILDRLLFRPLLTFMDQRRDKIDGARAAKETVLREREGEIARREEDRLAAEKRAMQEASDALDRVRAENARLLAEKKAKNEVHLAQERETLAEESDRILAAAEPRMEELITAFSGRLMSWRADADVPTDQ